VNDKGRYRRHPRSDAPANSSGGVICDRNSEPIIHGILKLLFAPDVPFRRLHRSVTKQKLNLLKFPSAAMVKPGACAPKIVGRKIAYAGLSRAPLHRPLSEDLIDQPPDAERGRLIVAADRERSSRNDRYLTTTERLNVSRGSLQYQAINRSIAY
jgi:hypothetical protein